MKEPVYYWNFIKYRQLVVVPFSSDISCHVDSLFWLG